MTRYTVIIKVEVVEGVEANNEKEAEQLAVRILEVSLSHCPSNYSVMEVTVCENPKKKENPK